MDYAVIAAGTLALAWTTALTWSAATDPLASRRRLQLALSVGLCTFSATALAFVGSVVAWFWFMVASVVYLLIVLLPVGVHTRRSRERRGWSATWWLAQEAAPEPPNTRMEQNAEL